jgi:hypothetical protein
MTDRNSLYLSRILFEIKFSKLSVMEDLSIEQNKSFAEILIPKELKNNITLQSDL